MKKFDNFSAVLNIETLNGCDQTKGLMEHKIKKYSYNVVFERFKAD